MKSKTNDRIYIKQWLELKPYDEPIPTDGYYLQLANKVKKILIKKEHASQLEKFITNDDINVLSCFIISYFEDIISGSNIWNTFTKCYQKLYNKTLPFYNTEVYFKNEINDQDVNFLIWYFLNSVQDDVFVSPYNEFIDNITAEIMEILDDEYEYAPANPILKYYYQLKEEETNFYQIRTFIEILLLNTYLFHPDIRYRYNNLKKDIKKIEIEKQDLYAYDLKIFITCNAYTRLLSMRGKEWAAELLGKNHALYNDILNMSHRLMGYFLYKGQDEYNIYLEHIASGKKFELTKKSYENYNNLKVMDTILYISIVRWQDEWWFSGVSFQSNYNTDIIAQEKDSFSSQGAVNFLDYERYDLEKELKNQMNVFLRFNQGSQIAFMEAKKINDFIKESVEYYNNSIKISKKQQKHEEQKNKEEKSSVKDYNIYESFENETQSALFFFNPKSGGEIAIGINSAFPMKNNPFYNPEESESHFWYLLFSSSFSVELVNYCIEHCKDKLPFLTKYEWKSYLEELDFLMRLFKYDTYHSKPTITFRIKEKK